MAGAIAWAVTDRKVLGETFAGGPEAGRLPPIAVTAVLFRIVTVSPRIMEN